jgi:hypothetical protein
MIVAPRSPDTGQFPDIGLVIMEAACDRALAAEIVQFDGLHLLG